MYTSLFLFDHFYHLEYVFPYSISLTQRETKQQKKKKNLLELTRVNQKKIKSS